MLGVDNLACVGRLWDATSALGMRSTGNSGLKPKAFMTRTVIVQRLARLSQLAMPVLL